MAGYGTNTIHRPSATWASDATYDLKDDYSIRENRNKLILPYNIPYSPEAAAVRIVRNISYFAFYYTVFLWVILFIVLLLVDRRTLSLMYLIALSIVAYVYLLLGRSLPNSVVLHKILDKRLVLALLAVVTTVVMILTHATVHFFGSIAGATPVILIHAVFRARDDLFVNDARDAGLVSLVSEETGSVDPLACV